MTNRPPPRRAGSKPLPAHTTSPLIERFDREPALLLKRRRGSSIDAVTLKPEYITIDETAAYWRCSRKKVERELRDKALPKFKFGHRTLLLIRDVRKHARKMRQK